jgi:hypothetical protein
MGFGKGMRVKGVRKRVMVSTEVKLIYIVSVQTSGAGSHSRQIATRLNSVADAYRAQSSRKLLCTL